MKPVSNVWRTLAETQKSPSPSIMLREGHMLKNGCKKFHGYYSAANFSTPDIKRLERWVESQSSCESLALSALTPINAPTSTPKASSVATI